MTKKTQKAGKPKGFVGAMPPDYRSTVHSFNKDKKPVAVIIVVIPWKRSQEENKPENPFDRCTCYQTENWSSQWIGKEKNEGRSRGVNRPMELQIDAESFMMAFNMERFSGARLDQGTEPKMPVRK